MHRPLAIAVLLVTLSVSTVPDAKSAAKPAPVARPAKPTVAVFAGGCFWCMETQFEGVPGVTSVISGYTGGHKANPTYEEVCAHTTGHYESIQVTFDPARITYAELLERFWHGIDPTQADGQFCDIGKQYRSAIFVHDEAQRRAALSILAARRRLRSQYSRL